MGIYNNVLKTLCLNFVSIFLTLTVSIRQQFFHAMNIHVITRYWYLYYFLLNILYKTCLPTFKIQKISIYTLILTCISIQHFNNKTKKKVILQIR